MIAVCGRVIWTIPFPSNGNRIGANRPRGGSSIDFQAGGSLTMKFRFSRRMMMQGVGGAVFAQSAATADPAPAPRTWPIEEGPDTPKICLAPGDGGGPLPASMLAATAVAPGAAGRGGRRRRWRRVWWISGAENGSCTSAALGSGGTRRLRWQSHRQLSAHPPARRDASSRRGNRR